jgi:hypothetical protein
MLQNKHQHIVRQLLQCQPLSSPHASAHAVTMENVDRVLLVDQSFAGSNKKLPNADRRRARKRW